MKDSRKYCPMIGRQCIDYRCQWFGCGCPAFPNPRSCEEVEGELNDQENMMACRQAEVILLKDKLGTRAYNALRINFHSYARGTRHCLPLDRPLESLSFEEIKGGAGIGNVSADEIYFAIHGVHDRATPFIR